VTCPDGYRLDSDGGQDDCYHPQTHDMKMSRCSKEGRDLYVEFDKNGGRGNKDACIHIAKPHSLTCQRGFLISGDAVKNTREGNFDKKLSRYEVRGWSCIDPSRPGED
jgi:hypothetical protein